MLNVKKIFRIVLLQTYMSSSNSKTTDHGFLTTSLGMINFPPKPGLIIQRPPYLGV